MVVMLAQPTTLADLMGGEQHVVPLKTLAVGLSRRLERTA